uniref:Ig-like domain-containing protein n=1 Tax=Catharus ustulatus TaxID=91951 RepID=A0A8C3Y465_CATUS
AGSPETPQLLVEPPWTPAVLWDRVTLTCQGSGTAGDTTWYKDGRRWWQEGPDSFTVTESGTYQCQRPGTGLSPPVPPVPQTWLVLQVPARALLEGDTVTLRCRVWRDSSVTSVSFYRDGKELGTLQDGTELSLSPLQRNHSGRYHCRGLVYYLERWEQSEPVTVTVQGEDFGDSFNCLIGIWRFSLTSRLELLGAQGVQSIGVVQGFWGTPGMLRGPGGNGGCSGV